MNRAGWLGVFWLGIGLTCAAESIANLTVEDFFRTSEISGPDLSDDGKRVVFLVRNSEGRRSIATYDFEKGKGQVVFVPKDYDIDFAFWKGERIVFGGDAGGNEIPALRSIAATGRDLRDLAESFQWFRASMGPWGGSIFSTLPNDPNHLLVAGLGTERGLEGVLVATGEYGLYKLDVRTGKRTAVELWDRKARNYFVDDRTGDVYGRAMEDGDEIVFEVRGREGKYRRFGTARASDESWAFLGVLPEGNRILVSRRTSEYDRGALFTLDLEKLDLGRPVYVPPAGEILAVERTRAGRLVGVRYEDEKPHTDWFDAGFARTYASLANTFPGSDVEFVSASADEKRIVIRVQSDRDPGAYFLFDREQTQLVPLGRVNPRIVAEKMASRRPVEFAARDGVVVRGYLTIPLGREKQRNPLIVLPHGGPFGIRDRWVFDPEAAFLADRGYTVLQVNFRGSGGYGLSFEVLGKRQWGKAMQDDLTDAVEWSIAQGYTSRGSVGICGASYGGYAVLAGLAFTPELYRCGVNYVGVSDLKLLASPSEPITRAREVWFHDWVAATPAEIRERSPVHFVDRIRVPSFHAYGENDPRVDIHNWRVLEAALKKNGKPYEFMRQKYEGHGFESEAARIRLYRAVEQFLETHLKSAASAPAS